MQIWMTKQKKIKNSHISQVDFRQVKERASMSLTIEVSATAGLALLSFTLFLCPTWRRENRLRERNSIYGMARAWADC